MLECKASFPIMSFKAVLRLSPYMEINVIISVKQFKPITILSPAPHKQPTDGVCEMNTSGERKKILHPIKIHYSKYIRIHLQ